MASSSFPRLSEELQRSGSPISPIRNPAHPPQPSVQDEINEKLAPPDDPYYGRSSFDNEAEVLSPTAGQRADASRLEDDLEILRAERLVSHQEHEELQHAGSRPNHRRHDTEVEDTFNPPVNVKDIKSSKLRDENVALLRFARFLKKFPRFIRYFVYLIPGAALLLVPIILGIFAVDEDTHPVGGTGGTYLMWFGIWLEIVWGSLWVSRMVTSLMPPLFQFIAKASGSTNAKKWRDIGLQLELHTALFLWLLAVLVSFKPTCDGHRVPIPPGHEEGDGVQWIDIVFKIIIAFFILVTLNFVEKICIQWIAGAFHERTYATRIENNKGDIRQLVHLFEHAKAHLQHTDSFWQGSSRDNTGGTATPMRVLQENAAHVFGKVGQVAGKVGNDLIGRKVENANHPRKIVAELLRTTSSAHTLARLIYRSVVREGQEMVFLEDMQAAFKMPEEGEAAFNVFDKDLNGDISMEELEAVTNEIGMEKKAIAASLKDLDSVIKKLDKVFLFVIVIITIIIFVSIISNSAAAGLASAGSAVLGLAWVLQATAQEFLQSIIFVFVKHPFDVGDRVTVYGSTGANMTGDDYYVTEISLLYTEFKKLEGHFVQAPNSLLNTLFILNQRRSNGLADPISLKIRFGTPAWMIDELKARMLKFCLDNKRDYQGTILTELTGIEEQRAAKLNVIFIHKTNFQNEVMRMGRHNRFVLELMANMVDIGIQAPYRVEPGGSREHPMYWAGMQPPPAYGEREQANNNLLNNENLGRPARSPARQPSITSGGSQRFAPSASTNMEMTGFGDVFENRREVMIANRLASIREKNLAVEKHEQTVKAENAAVTGSTSALAPERSHDSQSRSRLFSRPRSKSTLPMHNRPRGSSDFV